METIFVSPDKKKEFWAMKVIFLNDLLGDLGHALRLVCFFLWAQKGRCNKNDFNLNGCFTLKKFLFWG